MSLSDEAVPAINRHSFRSGNEWYSLAYNELTRPPRSGAVVGGQVGICRGEKWYSLADGLNVGWRLHPMVRGV